VAEKNRQRRVQNHSGEIRLNVSCVVRLTPADCPIGVFDSGVGGLSVLRALRTELPSESFVYVADSGYAPYGERDDRFVLQRAFAITYYLLEQCAIKALVVACNTATAAAIHALREKFPDLPIVGIEPALKPAVAATRTGVIGVMATQGTLNSQKFQSLLAAFQGQATFQLQACNGLADAIEHAVATKIVAACAYYTGAMGTFGSEAGAIDTLVLGCTHYPFVATELRATVGAGVTLLEGGAPVARQTHRLLREHQLRTPLTSAEPPAPIFFSTGGTEALKNATRRWLQLDIDPKVVDIGGPAAHSGSC
jgi:glutamate racemase